MLRALLGRVEITREASGGEKVKTWSLQAFRCQMFLHVITGAVSSLRRHQYSGYLSLGKNYNANHHNRPTTISTTQVPHFTESFEAARGI